MGRRRLSGDAMIAYVTLGSNDMGRSSAFYDAVLAELGVGRLRELGAGVAWGLGPGPALLVTPPWNGGEAGAGNGSMTALGAATHEAVRAVHARALAHGGACEGKPGERGPGFYAAYFRDPDGNKLAAVCLG